MSLIKFIVMKNKKLLSLLIDFIFLSLFVGAMLLLSSFSGYAQSVGINNPTPHAKSLLDLTSTDKGLLAPRMTQAQRLAMFPSSDVTAKGMLVYQTDNTQGFYYYDGTTWMLVQANAGWGLTGNSATNATSNFIGTCDSTDVVFKSKNQEAIRIKPNKKIGFGTNNPGLGYPSARIEIADENGLNSDFAMRTAAGGHPEIVLEASNGTLSAPTQSTAGAWGGAIIGQVYDGSQFSNTAALIFGTEGANTPGNIAGTFQFNTSKLGPNGWEKMRLTAMGNLGVGIVNPLNRVDVGGNVNVMLDSNYRINNVRVLSTKGTSNLFCGSNAGLISTGGYNTFVGYNSGMSNTTGGSNAFFGQSSGINNTSGNFNSLLGNNSGLHNTSGSGNVFIGSHSGFNNLTGAYNTFIGINSGYNNLDSNNVFVGQGAGFNNTTGSGNLFLGSATGVVNTSGKYNCFSGMFAGYNNSTGNNNSIFGYNAGTSNTTGSNNTYFGSNANGAATISNAGAFGNKAYVALSNSIVLGDTGVNIGINNSSPLYPIHFRNTLGDKICFWGNAGAHYGIGIQGYLMQIHSASATDDIAFGYGSSAAFTERMRIKGNGKVGIGTSTPGNLCTSIALEIADSTGINKDFYLRSTNNSNYQQVIAFARTRGTFSAPTIVQVNDNIGRLSGTGYDGAALLTASEIQYHIDSTASAGNMPGNITFHTNGGNTNSYCAERMRIDHNGNVGIATSAPTAALEINGYTKLGSNAPAIKVLKLTGTTSVSQGLSVTINHGLNFAKIISVQVLVEKSTSLLIPPANTISAGDEFNFQITTTAISITNKMGNSGNILSKPVRIVITYEE